MLHLSCLFTDLQPAVEEVPIDDKEISTPSMKKRKRFSISTSIENRVTASHAEMILEIEKSKRDIALQLLRIKRIKLRAYLKDLDRNGVDILDEIQELNNMTLDEEHHRTTR